MSNRAEREAEDLYERENDASPVPGGEADNSYVGETNPNLRNVVPVQNDEADIDDPMQPPYSNSDQQLGMSARLILFSMNDSDVSQHKTNARQLISPTSSEETDCDTPSHARETDTMRVLTRTTSPPKFIKARTVGPLPAEQSSDGWRHYRLSLWFD